MLSGSQYDSSLATLYLNFEMASVIGRILDVMPLLVGGKQFWLNRRGIFLSLESKNSLIVLKTSRS